MEDERYRVESGRVLQDLLSHARSLRTSSRDVLVQNLI
jgi:hypothetical protein